MVLPAHFTPAASREAARTLFALSVRQVEVEVFSYCNRTYWFCPNSTIDRQTKNHHMDEALYLRILGELAEIDFSAIVTYSRYNEPLADRIILERLRQARKALPRAVLSTHTNGDYLTRSYLDDLRDAGLNRIVIMSYLGNKEAFSDMKSPSRLTTKAAEPGLRCEFTMALAGVRYDATLAYDGMELYIQARNFDELGTDRGKLVQLKPYVRTSWCPVVFQDLYIDWNGRVVPCCNIRSDAAKHNDDVVGDLNSGESTFEARAGRNLTEWRRSLFNLAEKAAPCDSCRYALMPDDEESRNLVGIINRAFIQNSVPHAQHHRLAASVNSLPTSASESKVVSSRPLKPFRISERSLSEKRSTPPVV